MDKRLCIALLLISLVFSGRAQSNYYATDSSAHIVGKEDVMIDMGDKKNACYLYFRRNGKIIPKYGPNEITEFGFNNGRMYRSKPIELNGTTKKVFLEQLAKGEITLYYYKSKKTRTYFLEIDSVLTELPIKDKENKKNYKKQLSEITEANPFASKALPYLTYSKTSMSNYFKYLNRFTEYPQLKYGFLVSYDINALSVNKNLKIPGISKIPNERSYSFGLFIDYPIALSNVLLHTELTYTQHNFASYETAPIINFKYISITYNYLSKSSAVELPIYFRYSPPKKDIQPFLETGLTMSYLFKRENFLFDIIEISENTFETYERNDAGNYSGKTQYAFGFGGGFMVHLNRKYTLYLSTRYSSQISFLTSTRLLASTFGFSTALGF